MVNIPSRTVFFADILGFGNLSSTKGAESAADALSDLAHLFSSDELVQFLRRPLWEERYGLSDSIFLVTEGAVAACSAAAEFFFDLAYVNQGASAPVLLRGTIAVGEALRVKPIFPESATANLIGEAVVRAVLLEKQGSKGPRLLLAPEAAEAWERSEQPASWLLHRSGEGAEILWPLPPDPDVANGLLIGEVCATALRLVREHGAHPRFGYHYLGYLDLMTRSLQRLNEKRPDEAKVAIRVSGLKEQVSLLEEMLFQARAQEPLLERLRGLVRLAIRPASAPTPSGGRRPGR